MDLIEKSADKRVNYDWYIFVSGKLLKTFDETLWDVNSSGKIDIGYFIVNI